MTLSPAAVSEDGKTVLFNYARSLTSISRKG